MLGIERLLEFQGAEVWRHQPHRQLLRFVRQIPIWASLATGQASLMAQPDWTTVPWDLEEGEKPADQYLFDILAESTILYRDRNSIINPDPRVSGAQPNFDNTLAHGFAILDRLSDWHESWRRSHVGACIELPSNGESEDGSVPWSYDLSFSNAADAKTVALYNTVRLIVLGILRPLLLINTVHPVIDWSQLDCTERMEYSDWPSTINACAIRICRCAEYNLVNHRESMGGFVIQSSMRLAWLALGKSSSAEGRWLESIFEETKDVPLAFTTQVVSRSAFDNARNSIF